MRGLGSERLRGASYAFLPYLKKVRSIFVGIGEGLRIFVPCFLHTRELIPSYETPRRRTQRVAGRAVNTVTRGWVGAPIMTQLLVPLIDVCLGRGILPLRLQYLPEFFSARYRPEICPGITFFGF